MLCDGALCNRSGAPMGRNGGQASSTIRNSRVLTCGARLAPEACETVDVPAPAAARYVQFSGSGDEIDAPCGWG